MNRKITTQMKRMMLMAFIFSSSLATFAVEWGTGTHTLNPGTITDNINLSGNVTIHVPSGK